MPLDSLPTIVAIVLVAAILAVALIGVGTLLWMLGRLFAAPGVVVHEFAHASACRLVGVPVIEAVYFQFGDPAGYVSHAQSDRYRETFVISVAPFLVNTVVAFGAFLAFTMLVTSADVASIGDARTVSRETLAAVAVLGWLGLSVGMHAFPSTGDANVLWTRSRAEWRRSPVVLLGVPVIAVIYFANLLSWLWADVLYALGLGVLAWTIVVGPVF